MEQAYRTEHGLNKISPHVEDTGEVNWLIADALQMEVSIPVIAESVMRLFESRDQRRTASRAVAAMRHGFGGHSYGHELNVERERAKGRVGDFYRPRQP